MCERFVSVFVTSNSQCRYTHFKIKGNPRPCSIFVEIVEMVKPNYYPTTITTTIVRNNFGTIVTHCGDTHASCHTHCAGDDGQPPLHVHRTTSTHPFKPKHVDVTSVEFKTRSTLGQWSVSIMLTVKSRIMGLQSEQEKSRRPR